ncbi:hypothetical protein LCGC14_1282500 [marine sediment metagenome]|uniref:Uncharacterized protein n=1 Tax=marine sediment metagenome TaxID=412755 RepID=A0A0F9KUT6_9ZZZZ
MGKKGLVTHKKEDMGYDMGLNLKGLHLHSGFLKKYLNVSELDTFSYPRREKKEINVVCCYCKEGVLILKDVQPHYSGGMRPTPSSMRHTSNNYEYGCTKCDARFFGSYQWMWID